MCLIFLLTWHAGLSNISYERSRKSGVCRADLINTAMGEQGKTNESLAKAAGLSHATISAIRNGEENVRLLSLKKAARALNLRVEIRFVPMTQPVVTVG